MEVEDGSGDGGRGNYASVTAENGVDNSNSKQRSPDQFPMFGNIADDYHLLENLNRYSRFCEQYNVAIPQMAQSLARAIGMSNGGKYNVLVYDYVNAIPDYPPTQNGMKAPLTGEGRICNLICYKMQLFAVVVFPASENVTFYFPEFSNFTPQVQKLIYSFGNKNLRFCGEQQALAVDFTPLITEQPRVQLQQQSLLLTATLKRSLSEDLHQANPEEFEDKRQRQDPSFDYVLIE